MIGMIFKVSTYTSMLKPRSNPTMIGAIVFTEMMDMINKKRIPSLPFLGSLVSVYTVFVMFNIPSL
jgi:hypothetical protein